MSTQMINVTGLAKWVKLFDYNKDDNEAFHGPGGGYTINVVLDKAELDKVKDSGARLKPTITDDGVELKFRRKHTHPSIPEFGGRPKVVDAENNLWDDQITIGNGSQVEVWFTVYDTTMGKGTRLEGVRVLDLVEYVSEDGDKAPRLPF